MLSELAKNLSAFQTCDTARPLLQKACRDNSDIATFEQIGASEEGRPIDAVVMGAGPQRVSLIAGAHSDEPVGPETLRTQIIAGLQQRDAIADLLARFKFIIVPHINPDAEARNRKWITKWPRVEDYLLHAFREPPGRDLEFGFPQMRVENGHVADFLQSHAPFVLHASLHGMGFAEGAMLLIERHWIDRTKKVREQFKRAASDAGLRLHDHDRKGDKGFHYIEAGFWTTPEGAAMRAFFESRGDATTARQFHDSSMEFVRKLGGDPLCLVTELPLFIINKEIPNRQPGVPQAYFDFAEKILFLRFELLAGRSIDSILEEYAVQSFSLQQAVAMQLRVIEFGLEAIAAQ
jgi:hypothetical protein